MAKLLLNDAMIKKISSLIENGNYARIASQYVGIDESTYYRWLQSAEKDFSNGKSDTIFCKFYKAIKEAEAKAEVNAVANIKLAGEDGSWQALAWMLERKYFSRWGAKQQIEHSGNINNVSITKPSELSEEQLLDVINGKATFRDFSTTSGSTKGNS